jgi:hypothetical protein
MNITIVEAPRTTAFTTVARMREELGLTTTAQDTRLNTLIEEVSADIVAYCQQPLIRQTVTERQVGLGRTVQVLSVTPVPHGGVTQARLRGCSISGYQVSDPEAGFLLRTGGAWWINRWPDSRAYNQWIERDPAIMPGMQLLEFDYSGGYILPGDDIVCSGIASAASATSTFTLDDDAENSTTFPILVSGESVVVGGFTNSANNGKFTVLERTPYTLRVAGTLVDETPSGSSVVTFNSRNLPRDLERLCVTEVKGRYLSQYRDPTIKSESLGDWSASYGSAAGDIQGYGGLLPGVANGLDKYVRLDS